MAQANQPNTGRRMNAVYGYIRGIHIRKKERDRDVAKQSTRVKRYIKRLLGFHHNLVPGQIFCDITSFTSQPNAIELPASREMFRKLRKGDHVVLGSIARTHSGVVLLMDYLAVLDKRGMTTHLADKGLEVNLNAPAGKLVRRTLELVREQRFMLSTQGVLQSQWERDPSLRDRLA